MKRRNIITGMAVLFLAGGLSFTSCKKDDTASTNPNSTSITIQQAIQVQNSDAQDAIADKTEEDIDNKLEELENNNYSTLTTKSEIAGLTDTVVFTVDHPDTTTFPKVVTLTYYSYQDSSTTENITKNGEIIVTINRSDTRHPRLISRSFVFDDFAVTTDSTTIILNGTRLVKRTKDALKLTGLEFARISVTDSIKASLKYSVATTGKTDTLKFTRNVSKLRTAIAHYRNMNYVAGALNDNLRNLRFRHFPSLDSLTYSGTVTGINEKGDEYSKTITSPLIIIVYKGSLVITAGTMTYTVGTADSYQITFEQDPEHLHFTLVTIKDNNTDKTKSFDRRFSHIFKKWW